MISIVDTDVVVVPTGVANVASMSSALRRSGATPRLARNAGDVASAERLIVPGVGSFAAGMDSLTRFGLADALASRIESGRPTLAVCLGMHLLCRGSEEADGVPGLGLVDRSISRFGAGVRTPNMGWSLVKAGPGFADFTDGYAYFAHSYYLDGVPRGWNAAYASNGNQRFVAAASRGDVLLCQFHPELSGPFGLDILRRFVLQNPTKEVA